MDNIKVISRPKVRFCQFSDNARNKAEIVEGCKEQQAAPRANGPKIREIVSLEKLVKVVKDPTKSVSVCNKDVPPSNSNIDTSSHYDATLSGDIQDASLSNKNIPKVESTMILCDANGIRNTKKSCKISQLDKSSRNDVLKDRTKDSRQKGKENKSTLKTSSKNISETREPGNSQRIRSVNQEKFELSTGNNNRNTRDFKRSKMTMKSQSAPSVTKKTKNSMIEGKVLSAKPVPSRAISSHVYKTMAKNKMSPVKKIALRNVLGPEIKTSVGLFRKEQTNAEISNANDKRIVTLDVTVKDLAQPEYNSIMCTVNKLKELEQRKVATDINGLPSALKNFLNGKISAALDFPLDETIYKNLIDLSIDEKQLPSTVTRSKDPEPRQKDIVPKLSDFFVPEDTKEICEAVHVKSRTAKIDDNWNAFKISDRILEWKCSIDDVD